MHIEFLVEDSSGRRLLELLIPKIIGEQSAPHTWRLHDYKGVGEIPPKLTRKADPKKRILLDQLPRILRGNNKTSGIDATVVVLDSDRRDCKKFLAELLRLRDSCTSPRKTTLFRLAIEEMEAWYLGDPKAVLTAYPGADKAVLDRYKQDSVCGTWEVLADAVHPGGAQAIKDAGWPLPGNLKHEFANKIGPHLDLKRNKSPSFHKLCDGLRRLVGSR
ncbi:MAG: hypothetical protein IPI49_16495 [Myxococcales bacterium]|nr:hypothetical protein [Myxococcales bacterium]